MSYPIGSNKDFIIVRPQGQLQVAFIYSSLYYSLDFDEWLDQQLSPIAQPNDNSQFLYCLGCNELLPRYLIHYTTGFCHSCRGDDDLM